MRRRRNRAPAEQAEKPTTATRPDWSWAHVVQLEDVLLLAWLLLAESLLLRMTDRSPEMWIEPGPGGSPWGLPWTAWLVLASWAFVVFTKGTCDRTLDGGIGRRILILGPAFPLLSMFAAIVSVIRGGPRSIRSHGGDTADWPMPAAPDWLRRTAAAPAILVGESGFRAILTQEMERLAGVVTPDSASYVAAGQADRVLDLGLRLLLLAVPFLFVIVGPRVAAGATADWRYWVVRFALYAGAAITGSTAIGWLG
jgi:hypothetical protein